MRTLLVGGSASGAGKTTLACRILAALPGWGALKLSTVRPHACRPGAACPDCHGLAGPFRVVTASDELDREGTDTARLRAAGAARVVWAVAREEHLGEAIAEALGACEGLPGVVVEGNSFARHRRPDRTILVMREGKRGTKESARALLASADVVVVNRPGGPAHAGTPPCDAASPFDPEVLDLLARVRTWFPR